MSVSLRSFSSDVSESATSVAIPEPSGAQNGDWIVVHIASNFLVNISDDNGATPYTEEWTRQNTDGDATCSIFVRKKQAGDPSTLNFDHDGSADRITGVAMAFQDGDSSDAFDIAPSGTTENLVGASSSHACNDITTLIANAIHIVIDAMDSGATTWSSIPSGYTPIVELDGDGQHTAISYKVIATPSATGVQTYTNGGTPKAITQSFSIADDGGGGPIIDQVSRRRFVALNTDEYPPSW